MSRVFLAFASVFVPDWNLVDESLQDASVTMWKPHLDSPLLKATIATYSEMFGGSLKFTRFTPGFLTL